ncbi:glycerophosphoryl diester phosphodiesterase [Marinomonas balearica]|uniref:Glycerophosphoryl diester phosphodiesterase n=1 Tax=Marinomonas balearica TaxID=491947 RepID=A0A4R6M2X0_9GAMM|nr:glycerophosphoryl diester phosphodiesterase [Marinomonas balearica]TDO95524.1 glycerophosphoryl diester phosphodiesterase [Marinomonas balearica]
MQLTKVIGHRGAASLAPENTLAAIKAAAASGVKWVEIDVSLIADGALVIFHDETLDRCSTGSGKLRAANLEYIASLDAGSWFSPDYEGEVIPTLTEALDCIQSLGLGLNLEIKHDDVDIDQIVPNVIKALQEQWQDNEKLIISSFNHAALVMCHEMDSSRHLGQLYESIPNNWQEQLADIDAFSLHCDYALLTESQANDIKQAGYKLLCYTINSVSLAEQHWRWGMDSVITDDPNVFMHLDK